MPYVSCHIIIRKPVRVDILYISSENNLLSGVRNSLATGGENRLQCLLAEYSPQELVSCRKNWHRRYALICTVHCALLTTSAAAMV